MDNELDIILVIKKSLEQKVSDQLERNINAGHPISRQQAIKMVIDGQQRELRLKADKNDKEGNEDKAEFLYKLSDLLPSLMHEVGLR
jgi:hypothetical protein